MTSLVGSGSVVVSEELSSELPSSDVETEGAELVKVGSDTDDEEGVVGKVVPELSEYADED